MISCFSQIHRQSKDWFEYGQAIIQYIEMRFCAFKQGCLCLWYWECLIILSWTRSIIYIKFCLVGYVKKCFDLNDRDHDLKLTAIFECICDLLLSFFSTVCLWIIFSVLLRSVTSNMSMSVCQYVNVRVKHVLMFMNGIWQWF